MARYQARGECRRLLGLASIAIMAASCAGRTRAPRAAGPAHSSAESERGARPPLGQALPGPAQTRATPGEAGRRELGLGESRAQALEVCGALGERSYLLRLRCPGGEAPPFHRPAPGQVGPRGLPTDDHIVDVFEVRCPAGARRLFLDMYHCDEPLPDAAPLGFTLAPAEPEPPETQPHSAG